MQDRCFGGASTLTHMWLFAEMRKVWAGNDTSPAPSFAPTVVIYRCANCGAERTQYVTSTGLRS